MRKFIEPPHFGRFVEVLWRCGFSLDTRARLWYNFEPIYGEIVKTRALAQTFHHTTVAQGCQYIYKKNPPDFVGWVFYVFGG